MLIVATATVSICGVLFVPLGVSLHSHGRTATVVHLARMLYAMLLAATSVLITAILLDICWAERHELLWFLHARTWEFTIWVAVCVAILAGLLDLLIRVRGIRRNRSLTYPNFSLRGLPKSRLWPHLILWILFLSFVVRAHKLDFQPLDDDEYASTQAILAIAESGIPHFVPERVWYTRSPLFHYFHGGIAALFGSNLWSMRLPSVLFGVATCWLTYLCGARLLKSPWIGMGAMLLMAIHPFEVYTGHVIRFYQMQQFLTLLTVYFFCKGFVSGQSQVFRYLTVAAFLASVLSQEISAVMGIPLFLGYLVFAEDNGRAANFKLVMVSCCALVFIALDYAVFQTRCMTRLEGISPNLEATVKLHLWYPYNFLSLFIGYSRLHVLLSLFMLIGLPLVCRQRQRNTMAFYLVLFSGVVMTNLMVTHVSLRYQYWLFPLWILLSLEGLRAFLVRACAYGLNYRREPRRHGMIMAVVATVVFIGFVLSFSPWRLIGSHDLKLLGDSTGAMQYIRRQLRDGDVVMVTEPHTHAAFIETGQVDYDLSVPLLYDYAIRQDGKLIDRNGAAEVVSNLPELMNVCQRHERIWLAVNREKLRSRGKNIRWEYPGARVDLFLRSNFELVHQTYLWSVYLRDGQNGHYTPFRCDRL
jgi:4-amino-4-deoxy-L-arabinose transferase-like glycosyltransferase